MDASGTPDLLLGPQLILRPMPARSAAEGVCFGVPFLLLAVLGELCDQGREGRTDPGRDAPCQAKQCLACAAYGEIHAAARPVVFSRSEDNRSAGRFLNVGCVASPVFRPSLLYL